MDIKKLDKVSKILIIILVIIASYFIVLTLIKPFFIKQPFSMAEMMNQVINKGLETENYIAAIIAIILGFFLSIYLFSEDKEHEYKIIRKTLSEDEKKILDEIKKAGEITQDSLRFRLDWSKAKVSTILTNLDKINLIQRERTGKTYKVYQQKNNK